MTDSFRDAAFDAAPVRVRFAPSPTGLLHVGNARMALINALFAKAQGGAFLLRLDDTDAERSKPEYAEAIQRDLAWLGLNWQALARQSERFAAYDAAVEKLKAAGRLYPCYETPDELERARKRLLARKLPPVYDRAALALTEADRAQLDAEGRRPHWRFKLESGALAWDDLARGRQSFQAESLSDPVLLREDGRYLYMLPSAVDDVDFAITHVLRGEDHIANTAVQTQIFEALGARPPAFGHLPLMTDAGGAGLSKRLGSASLAEMRNEGLEARALATYLTYLGTNETPTTGVAMDRLAESFDVAAYGRAAPKFDSEQLGHVQRHTLQGLDWAEARDRLAGLGLVDATEAFWQVIRPNLESLAEAKDWWDVAFGSITPVLEDRDFVAKAAAVLPPEPWGAETWGDWTQAVKAATGAKGKALFLPLRRAVTGRDRGPDLGELLPLIGRSRVLTRLGEDI
ncbi:MAG: glutamate--tRNA ligase [Rhodospirillales bacterium]